MVLQGVGCKVQVANQLYNKFYDRNPQPIQQSVWSSLGEWTKRWDGGDREREGGVTFVVADWSVSTGRYDDFCFSYGQGMFLHFVAYQNFSDRRDKFLGTNTIHNSNQKPIRSSRLVVHLRFG
jgi:hypothetical protein